MKPTFLFTFLLMLSSVAFSQQHFRPKPITDSTVVRDSTGNVLPLDKWQTAMRSGDYTIQIKLTATDTVYTLIRQTAEDRQHSYEARAKYEQALKDGTIK